MDSVKRTWGLVMAMVLVMLLWGCRTTRYVPVERVRTENRLLSKVVGDTVRDTVVMQRNVVRHDSMAVRMAGDTVFVEHWHKILRESANSGVKERVRTVHDTVFVEKVDSVAANTGWKAGAKVASIGRKKDGGGGSAKTVVMLMVLLLATGGLMYKLRKP